MPERKRVVAYSALAGRDDHAWSSQVTLFVFLQGGRFSTSTQRISLPWISAAPHRRPLTLAFSPHLLPLGHRRGRLLWRHTQIGPLCVSSYQVSVKASASQLRSASRNMHSASEHSEVVQAYLEKECALGRMLGPFSSAEQRDLPPCHINQFGVIPKGRNTGKWRLITDLSYPAGQSVNDSIDPDLCRLRYTTVDHVAEVVASYPPGTLLAKVDVESTYRLVPVHPLDRPLQAVEWAGALYVDPMLPFGLRSAPKIFKALADGLEWHLRWLGVRHVFHYLDDFLAGPPGSPECAAALKSLNVAFSSLGVPLAEHKRDGPTTCLTYLGIEVHTVAGQLRLPAEKLERLRTLLQEWGDRKVCQQCELESLIGVLSHAAKVVRSGRTFLRRMLDLLHGVPMHRPRPHPIRLNRSFLSDLAWWQLFASEWNGVSFLPPPEHLPVHRFASDASSGWGCGAWHSRHWFQLRWDERSAGLQIMTKELLPVVLACAVWGPLWAHTRVVCLCDNQAVVACLHSRTMGRGVDVVLGRTGLPLCQVAALVGYIALRGSRPGPFFLTSAGVPITKPEFIKVFRQTLSAVGYPAEEYAGHSFRIGAATSAALAGVEDSTIQLLGRWQSSAFLRYIRTPDGHLAELSHTLASQGLVTPSSSSGGQVLGTRHPSHSGRQS